MASSHFLISYCCSPEQITTFPWGTVPLWQLRKLSAVMRAPLSLHFSRLKKQSDLSHSYGFPLRPFTILSALLWTHSDISPSFLHWAASKCTQGLRRGADSFGGSTAPSLCRPICWAPGCVNTASAVGRWGCQVGAGHAAFMADMSGFCLYQVIVIYSADI